MNKTKWYTRAVYILIALAFAIGLTGVAAPIDVSANPGLTEWSKVTTPSEDDWVIAPESNVLLFTVGMSDGLETLPETIYAMGSSPDADSATGTALWKSTDSGATWSEKTQKIIDCIDDENLGTLIEINFIAAALDDADFMAVAAYVTDPTTPSGFAQQVFVSDDGANTFVWPGDLVDGSSTLTDVFCLAISPQVDGKRNIAAAGIYDPDGSWPMQYICRDGDEVGRVFRLETGGLFGSWKDASAYEGWDDYGAFTSRAVTRIAFAPSWEADRTVLVTTHTSQAWTGVEDCNVYAGATYLQSGTWGSTKAWNDAAGFPDAVFIEYSQVNWPFGRAFISGFVTPFDYEGRHSSNRYAWVYVDSNEYGGWIYQVINDSVDAVTQQIPGNPWLANLSYWGTIDSGKAIAGLIGYGGGEFTDCCEGVQVYRNDNIEDMQICCKAWKEACKPPTGIFACVPAFVSENKAYAVVGVHPALTGYYDLYDESAFSFSLDDGDNWNQLGLIDTYIDYLSDVAVSPSCDTTYLASVNEYHGCECDSVWMNADELSEAEEYNGVWIRVWCGALEGWWWDCNLDQGEELPRQGGLLRLAPEETDETLTVYLVDRDTDNVYYNGSKGLTCWEEGHSTVKEIGDLAVKDEATIYALSMESGDVAVSDDHGATATWDDVVDSEVDYGQTVAVHGDYVLVGGGYNADCQGGGDASYSDDGGETFTALDDVGDDGDVHVAFDSYFDDNGVVYAALGYSTDDNGIYRCTDLEGGAWDDIHALPYDYTGIVLDNPDGNPMTDAAHGGVLYASAWDITWDGDEFVDPYEPGDYYSGVARCLTPAEDVCCGEESWDYLIQGLSAYEEYFELQPSALKICGCLTADTNSHLYAIDDYWEWYDMSDGSDGTLWVYEDCFAKAAPALLTPADDATIPADPCYCWNDEFVLKWDRQCNACSYDIQIAYDEDFNEIVPGWDVVEFDPPAGANPSMVVPNLGLGTGSCATTFYWRVRSADAETDEIIHSFWSEVRSFTVAQGAAAAIELTAPTNGATNVPTTSVSFTWSSVAGATGYDFVLSAHSDLSSPTATETGLTSTAYTYTGTPLSEDTPYYWQVSAVKDGRVISASAISTFTTKPAAPAAPKAPGTPIWVWVVIAIGAILVIVVVVLIFRTRRV
jgi:hypothetical protein